MEQKKVSNVFNINACENLQEPRDVLAFIKNRYTSFKEHTDARILIMAGHAMPFNLGNKVFLSLHSQVSDEVLAKMKLEKMHTFSEYTFDLGCQIVSALKHDGFHAQLVILINNITHILDAYHADANIQPGSTGEKIYTTDDLRHMLVADFHSDTKLPEPYFRSLMNYGLTLADIVSHDIPQLHVTKQGNKKWKTEKIYYFPEMTLQNNITRYTSKSDLLKKPFGILRDMNESALLELIEGYPDLHHILKDDFFCAQKDVPGMPGGLDCSKEMISLLSALFGVRDGLSTKTPLLYQPADTFTHNAFIAFIPMGCRNAVNFGSVISQKLIQPTSSYVEIVNIPFASNAEYSDFQILNRLKDK